MSEVTVTWHNSQSDNHRVSDLCYLSESDIRPASVNMAPRDWQDHPETLLYKLHTERLYDNGGYGVLSNSDGPQAGSGYHVMNWHPDIVYAGSRSYTLPGSEIKYPQSVLWYGQIDQAKSQGAKIILGSVNNYNRKMVSQAIKINDPNQHVRSFRSGDRWYREPGIRILPLKTLPYSVNIHHTEQWIMYHVFDWDFHTEFLDICKNNQFGR